MDYEKKIKNALNDKSVPFEVQAWLEEQFPELKESKDNRIMKVIRGWIYTRQASFFDNGISKEEILAWLEKQGEQKQDVNVQINPSEYINNIGGNGCYLKNATQTSTCSKKEEKVDNQNCVKSIYDIKPKFKIGDWISNDMCDVHIASIEDGMYYFDEGDGLSIVFVDEHYHLWTIEDAMDGDVLANDYHILILKELVYDWSSNGTSYSVKAYCGIKPNGNFEIGKDNWSFCGTLHIHPATKEQRDTLFAKMKKAGYAFNFEKKELKKLGQSEVTKISDQEEIAEIPFGAKDSGLQEAIYHIPKGFYAEIDDDKVVIKKGEKPAAWSKKDEKMFEYALNMIEWYSGKNEDKSRFVSDWLKSIKQRIGG